MNPPSYPRGSVEYVKAIVTADVTLDDSVTVAISISTGDNVSGYTHTWLPGAWEGTAGTKRTARTASPVTFDSSYPKATRPLFVKLTDSPEAPIIAAGQIAIGG